MYSFLAYWAVILTVSWLIGGALEYSEEHGGYVRGYPHSDTGLGNVGERWVEWRVCHGGTLISYLLSYFLLFPRALVIGYNVIAMYHSMFTLFIINTLAFIVNYAMAMALARAFGSWRPGWPLNPVQTCDHSPPVPDPAMVASLSFVFILAIMRHGCLVGIDGGMILNLLLLAGLYVVATVVNGYLYAWQAMASVGVALALSAVWAFSADLVLHRCMGILACSTSFSFYSSGAPSPSPSVPVARGVPSMGTFINENVMPISFHRMLYECASRFGLLAASFKGRTSRPTLHVHPPPQQRTKR